MDEQTRHEVQGDETGWQLREPSETYNVLLENEKDDIGSKNDYIWKNDAI